MFNILGFHCTLEDDDLDKYYGRGKDKEQEKKENMFYNNLMEDTDLLLNLTERDFRAILKLKEELSQANNFRPLLPDYKRKRYYIYLLFRMVCSYSIIYDSFSLFEILDIQNYTDYLLMQFDERKRTKGDITLEC